MTSPGKEFFLLSTIFPEIFSILSNNSWSFFFKISPSLTIAFPIFGLVLTKSLTSGPKISRSSNKLSSKISEIVFCKLISVFDVRSDNSILSFSHTFKSRSPSIFLLPLSIGLGNLVKYLILQLIY